ncbi:MAG: T9SS type A sorting domain-containing protein [FCB group bacterium]|jgi:photosystem II stability/assembly factor-like uncharacterized protein
MKTLFTLFVLFLATSYCYPQSGWVLQNTGTDYDIIGISCPDNNNCWALGRKYSLEPPLKDSIIILHSTNGGYNWETQYKVPDMNDWYFSMYYYNYLIDFYDKNNGCFGTYQYSFYTTNGGKNWILIDTNFIGGLSNIKYVNNHTIWALNGDYLECSTDNGKTWSVRYSAYNPSLSKVYFLDSLNGWIIYNISPDAITIINTTDGGKNWIVKTDSSDYSLYALDFIFTDKNTGWMCGGELFFTTDSGNSWNIKNIDTTFSYFTFVKIKFTDSNHGWILGRESGPQAYVLYKTTNGGEDWIKDVIIPNDTIRSMEFSDSQNGWITDWQGHIWHTTTGGVGVKDENISSNAVLIISPNPAQDLVSAKCNFPIPPNTKIELYSSEGLLIKDLKSINFAGKKQFQFSVGDLPTGIYFLKMSYSGGVRAYPVCVMN